MERPGQAQPLPHCLSNPSPSSPADPAPLCTPVLTLTSSEIRRQGRKQVQRGAVSSPGSHRKEERVPAAQPRSSNLPPTRAPSLEVQESQTGNCPFLPGASWLPGPPPCNPRLSCPMNPVLPFTTHSPRPIPLCPPRSALPVTNINEASAADKADLVSPSGGWGKTQPRSK